MSWGHPDKARKKTSCWKWSWVFFFFLSFFLLKYSQFTMLYWFQVYRKIIQLYICIYIYVCVYILFQILLHYRLLQDIEQIFFNCKMNCLAKSNFILLCIISDQISRSVMSNSLRPHSWDLKIDIGWMKHWRNLWL